MKFLPTATPRFVAASVRSLLGMGLIAGSLIGSTSMRADEAPEPFHPERFTDLGAPVQRNAVYNHVIGEDAEGNERYYQAYRGTPWFLLSIDPTTGEQREFIAEGFDGNPWSLVWASNKKLYITTGGGGTDDVFVFDPATEELNYLGRPTDTEQVVWTIAEADNGKLYGGTYPNAKLISIDLKTDELTDLGRISPDQPYIRNLATQGDYVYCNAGPSLPACWAYNIRTGETTQILPDALRTRDLLRYGTAEKRADGNVYIYLPNSDNMNFRVEGLEVTPVDDLPPATPESHMGRPDRAVLTMNDGTTLRVTVLSGPEKYFLRTPPGGKPERIEVDYTGSSTPLWAVEEGPDGLIYGTTRTPLTLFTVDPKNDHQAVALGNPMGSNGQVYSWQWHDDKLFMAAYGGERMSVWDPEQPWHFGGASGDNPLYLGTSKIGRPSSLVVSPDGKTLIAAGLPIYGKTGGLLTLITPSATGESAIEYLEDLWGDQSALSLATVPGTDLVCVGTTWRGGSGSKAEPAPPRLILWNAATRQVEFETQAIPGNGAVEQILCLDGLIYATSSEHQGGVNDDGFLVVFDPHQRKILHTAPLGHGPGSIFGLRYREADGMLYAISGDSVLCIDPQTYDIQRLGTYPGLGYGMALADDAIYFCADTRLIRFEIPPISNNE